MTLDLAALEALLTKATPGPYYWFMRECADKDALMVELAAVVDKTVAVNGYNLHGVGVGEPEPDADYLAVAHTGCGPRSPINAQLIVAAVNALPELIARMRELEQQVQACGIRPRGKSIAPEAHVDGKWCRDLRCSRCYSYKTAIELENHNHALAMRERCAHVCNEIADIHPEARTVATICAAAIRALKP